MKKRLLVITLVVVVSLIAVTPLFAHSGVDGVLVDSLTGEVWAHGGDVYVVENCTVTDGEISGGSLFAATGIVEYTTNPFTLPANGDFGFTWTVAPSNPVCIYIELDTTANPEYPFASVTLGPRNNLTFINGPIAFGEQETGTGPNAVTLTGLSAESANVWFPVGLVAGLSVLAMGALVVLRKR